MARQQFRKVLLMDGRLAAFERREFLLVVVDADYLVPKLGKASGCNKANIT